MTWHAILGQQKHVGLRYWDDDVVLVSSARLDNPCLIIQSSKGLSDIVVCGFILNIL